MVSFGAPGPRSKCCSWVSIFTSDSELTEGIAAIWLVMAETTYSGSTTLDSFSLKFAVESFWRISSGNSLFHSESLRFRRNRYPCRFHSFRFLFEFGFFHGFSSPWSFLSTVFQFFVDVRWLPSDRASFSTRLGIVEETSFWFPFFWKIYLQNCGTALKNWLPVFSLENPYVDIDETSSTLKRKVE